MKIVKNYTILPSRFKTQEERDAHEKWVLEMRGPYPGDSEQNVQAHPRGGQAGNTKIEEKTPPPDVSGAAPCSAGEVDSVYISVVDKNNVEVTNGFTFLTKKIPTKYIGYTVAQFLQELFEKGYLKEELKASATPPESASEMPSV